MAFYQDYKPRKTSKQEHIQKDWKRPDEGSRYGKGRAVDKPAFAERSNAQRPNGGSAPHAYNDAKRPYGAKPGSSFSQGNSNDRRPYRDNAVSGQVSEPRYGRPAPAQGNENRFAKPAEPRGYGRPAPAQGNENRFAKPAEPRRYGRPAPAQGNENRFAKPAEPRRYGRPAPAQGNENRFAKPAEINPQQPRFVPAEGRPHPAAPQFDTPYSAEPENLLSGRNPIREALKADRDIEKLLVAKGDLSGSAREIVAMAREKRIPVQVVERARLDQITPHHQGMLAFTSAYHYSDVESMLALAKERGEAPFIVVLDGVTDPHNLGAIIRTAACVGAHGVIVPERRAVGLTPAAVKASAGAVETVKVARVTNLTRTLQCLKTQGLWIFAADMEGEDYTSVNMDGPLCLVVGSEGEGISRLVLQEADHKVMLPMYGGVQSLNASVAAGILMYAARGCRK